MTSPGHDEQLDPRIQVELEKLNTATDDINKLESKLEETNNAFSSTFTESTARLKSMGKKLGSCIEKARPYYEALELARTSQLECQRAAVQYQRANALHQAAKETIALAEERFVNSRHENWQFDSAWQEMLNHATMKVMEAEAQKAASEREHLRRAGVFQEAEQRVQQLQRGLKSSINKSLVYFEEKSRVEAQLESQKERAQQLQASIAASKTAYAQSLRRLEQISEQIHEQRRCQMPREPGVGAELNSPPAGEDQHYNNDKHFTQHADISQEEKYWESLREKLEKLEVEEISDDKCRATDLGEVSSQECEESRERSVTGSSDTPSCDGERVVSGQSSSSSSSQGSKSDGESSCDGPAETQDDAAPDKRLPATCTPLHLDQENLQDKLSKGRRTPVGICEGSTTDELQNIGAIQNGLPVQVSHANKMSVPVVEDNMSQAVMNDASKRNMSQECPKMVTDDLRIIELDVDEVYEGNHYEGEAKEEGDGSSSPPPTPCQPSRGLTVIVEELEHCVLPE